MEPNLLRMASSLSQEIFLFSLISAITSQSSLIRSARTIPAGVPLIIHFWNTPRVTYITFLHYIFGHDELVLKSYSNLSRKSSFERVYSWAIESSLSSLSSILLNKGHTQIKTKRILIPKCSSEECDLLIYGHISCQCQLKSLRISSMHVRVAKRLINICTHISMKWEECMLLYNITCTYKYIYISKCVSCAEIICIKITYLFLIDYYFYLLFLPHSFFYKFV